MLLYQDSHGGGAFVAAHLTDFASARAGGRLRTRAVSAGWPPTGNCTISIWESEQHMLDFAYGDV